jgi:hypothetical protein
VAKDKIVLANEGWDINVASLTSPMVDIETSEGRLTVEQASASSMLVRNDHNQLVLREVNADTLSLENSGFDEEPDEVMIERAVARFTVDNDSGEVEIKNSRFLPASRITSDPEDGVRIVDCEGELLKVVQ